MTSHETKIMMNSRQSMVKYSTYDQRIQAYLAFNIGLQVDPSHQIFICCVLATGFVLWLGHHSVYDYLDNSRQGKPVANWFISFMSWMLLMT